MFSNFRERSKSTGSAYFNKGVAFFKALTNEPTLENLAKCWKNITKMLAQKEFNNSEKKKLNNLIEQLNKMILGCESSDEQDDLGEVWETVFEGSYLWTLSNGVNLGEIPFCRRSVTQLFTSLIHHSRHNLMPCKAFFDPLNQLLEFSFCFNPSPALLRLLEVLVRKCRIDPGMLHLFFVSGELKFFTYLIPALRLKSGRQNVDLCRKILFEVVKTPDEIISRFIAENTDFIAVLVESLRLRYRKLNVQIEQENDPWVSELLDWFTIVTSLNASVEPFFSALVVQELRLSFMDVCILPGLVEEGRAAYTLALTDALVRASPDVHVAVQWTRLLFSPGSIMYHYIAPQDGAPDALSTLALKLLDTLLNTRIHEVYDILFFYYLKAGKFLADGFEMGTSMLYPTSTDGIIDEVDPTLKRIRREKSMNLYMKEAEQKCLKLRQDYERWFNVSSDGEDVAEEELLESKAVSPALPPDPINTDVQSKSPPQSSSSPCTHIDIPNSNKVDNFFYQLDPHTPKTQSPYEPFENAGKQAEAVEAVTTTQQQNRATAAAPATALLGPCLASLFSRLRVAPHCSFQENIPLQSVFMHLIRNPNPLFHELFFNPNLPFQPQVPEFLPLLAEMYQNLHAEAEKDYSPDQMRQSLLQCKQRLELARNMSIAFQEPLDFMEENKNVLGLVFLEEFLKDVCCNNEMKWQIYQQFRGQGSDSDDSEGDDDSDSSDLELP